MRLEVKKRKEKLPHPDLNLTLTNLTSFERRITGSSLQHGDRNNFRSF